MQTKESDQTRGGTVAHGRGNDWLTPLRFAALLAALIIACFPHVIAGWETFYHRDFAGFGYPLAMYHREAFWNGEMPLWNPYSNCGTPFMAQWNTLTLYPLSIFYLLFPLSWSLGMFCLLHLFLGGMGMYYLAHRWTGNRLAASVAGAVFSFNGLTWYSLMWPNNSAALGWMPWVVLAIERSWRLGGRSIIVAGLAGAMQMLAGAPEVILQTWLFLGALWMVQVYGGTTPRLKLVIRASAGVLLVAALAAAQLIPFLDLLKHSQRNASFGGSQWAMPLAGIANYLVPLFRADTVSGGYAQHGQYWTGSYYLGIGVIFFALISVWKVRKPAVKLLLLVICVTLVMALGDNAGIYKFLRNIIPQIGFMRFPIKFVILATFVVPLLAAFGLAWFRELPDEGEPGISKWIKIPGAILLGLVILIVWYAFKFPAPYENVNLTIKNGFSRGFFLILILVCVQMLGRQKAFKMQVILQGALIVLLWMDVFTHSTNLSPTVRRDVHAPDTIRTYLKWGDQLRPGISRAMPSVEAMNKFQFTKVANPEDDVIGRRLALFGNYNLYDHACKFDGFYSLDVREFKEIVNDVYMGTNDVPKLKDFLGISHYSHTNGVDWVVRDSFLPMITIGQTPVFTDPANTLTKIMSADFEPSKIVYLPQEARETIHAKGNSQAKINSQSVTAQRIVSEVQVESPSMLVIAQGFYHPWKAYVDGNPIELWKANYAFQALEIPAGKHQVELVYQDRGFKVGSFISLAALLFCGVFWWYGRQQTVDKSIA